MPKGFAFGMARMPAAVLRFEIKDGMSSATSVAEACATRKLQKTQTVHTWQLDSNEKLQGVRLSPECNF